MGSLFRQLHAFEPPWPQVLFAPGLILCCVFLCLAFPSTEHRYLVSNPDLCTIGVLLPNVRQSLVTHVGGVYRHRSPMYQQRYLTNLYDVHNSNLQGNENATSGIRLERTAFRFRVFLQNRFENPGPSPARNAIRRWSS